MLPFIAMAPPPWKVMALSVIRTLTVFTVAASAGAAAAIYAAAYGINPEFFAFWRSLDAYRAGLRGRNDVLVLDPSSEFFRYFRQSGGRDGARGTAK